MCLHDALDKIISCDNQRVFIEFIDKYQSQTFSCRCSDKLNDIKLFSLFECIEKKSINILKYLLRFNLANKENNDKWTPLQLAMRYGHKEIVEMLLKAGADPNTQNNDKETPLHWAARNGNKEIVEMLLKAGADPNTQNNDKETPLHLAMRYGHKESVEMLLHAGANPNAEDKDKWTPLHLAARHDHKEIVEMLLHTGADLNVENNNKNTPLHLAARNGRKEIFIILYPKTDIKYRNCKQILGYMKKINYNPNDESRSIFILQSHEFDSASLFTKDYLCRDMILLILREVNDEKLFRESEELIN